MNYIMGINIVRVATYGINMMKVTAIYLILLGLTGTACAQKKQVFTIPDQELMSISQDPKKLNSDIRLPIIKGIGSNMDTGELMKVSKDAGHILSIGVSFNKDGNAFVLSADLDVHIPGISHDEAQSIAEKAHKACPYSKATRGNIDVRITAI